MAGWWDSTLMGARIGFLVFSSYIANNWPILLAPDDDECGNNRWNKNWQGNRSTRRKCAPVPLCPPQIRRYLTWARTRAAAVGMGAGIGTGCWMGGWGVGVRVPVGVRFFSPPRCPDRLRGPTQSPIHWVPEALLTTHHLVPRSRIRGSTHPLPHTPSWRSA
jgi:hypothetical protein